jgi:transposase-like protein
VLSVALNNKQIKAIELLVYQPYMTLNMVCQEVDVSRDTLHRWRTKTPEFQEALDKATKDRWKAAEQMAVNTMINLMSEGNFQATRYLLDNLGYKAPDKIEAQVDARAQVMFVDDLEDDEDADSS